ncbi:transmembrane signal receptor [Lithospermum erythrorhizon]|uniref:Transmembrane signal receptor n=1 Tax=Lithospermum erythrorhizon TaxID=34254 RepID=A0AAV3RZS6_LITER
MKLPLDISSHQPGMVCRLKKSLYGLCQTLRCWFSKLATSLKTYGFHQSYSNYSLFTYKKDHIEMGVLVYVDDLIISGNNSYVLSSFKGYLCACFHMKDLGVLKYFLGIEVARNSEGICLSQQKYTLDIISEIGLLGAKPAGYPIEHNHTLSIVTGTLLSDPKS